jgi:ketosteroid isomerase-like protein
MSEENAEMVRRLYERLNRGDVDGVVELCADDFFIDMSERVFNPDTYTGHDGIRRFHAGVRDAWQSDRWDVEETRVAGDAVVAMLHCHAQSREGGPGVEWRVAWLWKFRRGRPVALRFYRQQANAREAAGLRE